MVDEIQDAEIIEEPTASPAGWHYTPPRSKWFFIIELVWSVDYIGSPWRVLLNTIQFIFSFPAIALNILYLIMYVLFNIIKDLTIKIWAAIWNATSGIVAQIIKALGLIIKVIAFFAGLLLALYLIGKYDVIELIIKQFT